MNFRVVAFISASLMSTGALADEISSTCQNVIDALKAKESKVAEIKDVYECGPAFTHLGGKAPVAVDACLVYFEYDASPYPSYTIAAFQDVANNHVVDWITSSNVGHSYSGKHLCADVKTYAHVKNNGDTAEVQIDRSTASDAMFCPFHKLFSAYSTTCRKVASGL
jgi:hypothetical protein